MLQMPINKGEIEVGWMHSTAISINDFNKTFQFEYRQQIVWL